MTLLRRITQFPEKFLRRLPLRDQLLFLTATLIIIGTSVGLLALITEKTSNESLKKIQKYTSSAQWLTMAALKNEDIMRNIWSAVAHYQVGQTMDPTVKEKVRASLVHLGNLLEQAKNETGYNAHQSESLENTLQKFRESKEKLEKILDELTLRKLSLQELNNKVETESTAASKLNSEVMEAVFSTSDLSLDTYENSIVMERRVHIFCLLALITGFLTGLGTLIFVIRLSRSLGKMSENLHETSAALLGATFSLEKTGKNLSHGVARQKTAMHESMNVLEQFNHSISDANAGATETLLQAKNARNKAEEGKLNITNLSTSMTEVAAVYEHLQTINSVVAEMQRKTKVIHEIVFKTQILSFNAAIEAARAGENGRGFSVVATEIGDLATLSGVAAEEIRRLLEQSKTQTASIVEKMENRIRTAQNNSTLCLDAFGGISEAIHSFVPMLDKINAASIQQQGGIKQTKQSFLQISATAEDNAHAASQVTGLAPKLKNEATKMGKLIFGLETLLRGEQ